MKISKIISHNERKSNLSSLSSLKKSFTLIELSVVLLILSLFVGSLLVGRQIVDRTRIQRIIFEFDYYEKAFHQFYDTYRVVPGNFDERKCNKYKEFTSDGVDRCGYQDDMNSYFIVTRVNDPYLVGSYNSIRPFSTTMQTLYLAGLIDKWENYKLVNYENDYIPIVYDYHNHYLTHFDHMTSLFPSSSFDQRIYISFLGWRKLDDNLTKDFGAQHYLSYNETNEIHNEFFWSALNEHNVIMFKYLTDDSGVGKIGEEVCESFFIFFTSCKITDDPRKSTNKSALPAQLTSKLDAKIDDGRPGTGQLLAFHMVDDPKYCYDKKSRNVDKAIYNSDTNTAYGCNLLKVMHDLR